MNTQFGELVESHRRHFNSNVSKSVGSRIAQLQKLKGIIEANEESLQVAIAENYGKSVFETVD